MRAIAILAAGVVLTGCGSSPGTSGNNQPPPAYPFQAANTLQFVHEFGTNTSTGANNTVPGDTIAGLQADSSGNLLLAGSTFGNLPGYSSSAITKGTLYKLDANGNQIWAKELSSGSVGAFDGLVVNASGIFVVGDTNGAYPGASNPNGIDETFVAEYDTSGNLQWLKQYSSSQNVSPEFLCADDSGNLIFAGLIADSAGGQDLFVQKADLSGNTLWEKTYGNDAVDLMNGISVDASGGVYAVGATSGPFPGNQTATISQPFVLKLDGTTGATVWLQQFGDSSTFPIFYPSDVQAISGGKLDILGGNVLNDNGGFPSVQFEVMQMDAATGSALWHFQFGDAVGNIPGLLIVDPNGNIYATGMTEEALASGFTSHTPQDIFLAKIDSSGNGVWVQHFGAGLDGPPLTESLWVPFYLTLGNQGVYIGGMTRGQFPGFSNPNQYTDLFLAKFGQ
ncbi:MAG: hypothetical protein ACLGSH_01635 [Acidobacteriota bacterium]